MQLLSILFLVFFPIATLSTVLLPIQQCEKNFTGNNLLQTNINNLLLDLVGKTSLQGYAISSSASDSCETVYGVTLCQGDQSRKACSACITKAAQKIRSSCPNAAQIHTWHEDCYLHYDTENFIGKPEKSVGSVWYSLDASVNITKLQRAVSDLLAGEVLEETVRGAEKFGYGEKYVDENVTVYGTAQCTRDLGENACFDCLDYALRTVSANCYDKTGCRVFGSSCLVRFEIYKFLQVSSPVHAPAPAPSYVIGN
ncbi:cysteine-rich repeat secretory protein 55-like [Phalaenopsis equestris]|uniref:cysteine-rich repeat secretory protein 55-like n=1 Tax=Phalaenopsis equestris TaxID=78828 RepID=UPI0009E2BFB7|nr:cysteine-rich repeat secretory protein 55-like [Phalaenopsis equestris]